MDNHVICIRTSAEKIIKISFLLHFFNFNNAIPPIKIPRLRSPYIAVLMKYNKIRISGVETLLSIIGCRVGEGFKISQAIFKRIGKIAYAIRSHPKNFIFLFIMFSYHRVYTDPYTTIYATSATLR